jgi:hypothetical protein
VKADYQANRVRKTRHLVENSEKSEPNFSLRRCYTIFTELTHHCFKDSKHLPKERERCLRVEAAPSASYFPLQLFLVAKILL